MPKLDYDKVYNQLLIRKQLALKYWWNKKISDGSNIKFLLKYIIDKWQLVNDRIYGGIVEVDYEKIFWADKLSQKLYEEFERKRNLSYPNFISATLDKLPEIKREVGILGETIEKEYGVIVKEYAYYKAYEIFLKNFKNTTEHDNRIKGKLKKEDIENYFKSTFSEKQKDLKPILTEKQITHFLHANFSEFFPRTEILKFDTPNVTQKKLRKIIHQFYLQHSPQTRTDVYVNILLNNFSKFNNTVFASEKSNFSKY